MKKILVLMVLLCLISPLSAQYARRIVPLPALPATCNPLNGEVVMLTVGAGISPGIYNCTAVNTWRPAGIMGNQFVLQQGTLTGSFPFVNHTATWNNGAVTFTNFISTVTDTASAVGSTLFDLRVGANSMLNLRKDGFVTAAAAGGFGWTGRSLILSTADGRITLTNNALAGHSRLSFGPEATAYPALTASPTVAAQAQGFIITKSDGTTNVFADLGAATNGSITYCSDCLIANPCAGASTGAIAKRLNGVWVCN